MAGWWPSRQKDSGSGGSSGGAASGSSGSGGGSGSVGLFPAGKRQARVQLPALMLEVDAADVLQRAGAIDDISAAVAGGATAVVLRQGSEGSGELYEAAVRLKELLRGRAALLVSDRTDIVDVVGADGALLSPDGLPTVVAKRMLQVGRLGSGGWQQVAVCRCSFWLPRRCIVLLLFGVPLLLVLHGSPPPSFVLLPLLCPCSSRYHPPRPLPGWHWVIACAHLRPVRVSHSLHATLIKHPSGCQHTRRAAWRWWAAQWTALRQQPRQQPMAPTF